MILPNYEPEKRDPENDGYLRICFDPEASDTAERLLAELEGFCLKVLFADGREQDIVFGCVIQRDSGVTEVEAWQFDDTKPQSKGALVYYHLDEIAGFYVY